jgi:hypothetical protein
MTAHRSNQPIRSRPTQLSLRLLCDEPLRLSKPMKEQLVLVLAALLLDAAETTDCDEQQGDHDGPHRPENHR